MRSQNGLPTRERWHEAVFRVIYTEATMMLWPRLLHSARAINPAAADTLQEYMLAGGQFTPQGANLFPSGTMKVEEANRFKAERLQRIRPIIIQAINAAKAADHPWVPAVRAKWEALERECEQRFESIKFALHQDPVQRVAEYAAHLLDTAMATIMVGDAGPDVGVARRAGVPVIGVEFGYTDVPIAELKPDRLIAHMRDLPAAVDSLGKVASRT